MAWAVGHACRKLDGSLTEVGFDLPASRLNLSKVGLPQQIIGENNDWNV
jgi:hypothetical protein